jgi:hypothetical protein
VQGRLGKLGDIVRRNGGRHAHGNARGAIGEEIGEGRREDDRLLALAAVIGAKVDRVLADAVKQGLGDIGHAGFRVAIGRGTVAIDVAEIALALDQRIAGGKVLGETNQGVVDRLVAVGVEGAHDIADYLGALLERGAGIEAQDVHAVEDAAVDGLQAVARVGQGPIHDGREGVGEIALLQRLAQIDALERLWRRRFGSLTHG